MTRKQPYRAAVHLLNRKLIGTPV